MGGLGLSEASLLGPSRPPSPCVLTGSGLWAPTQYLSVGPDFLFWEHQSGWRRPGLTASFNLIAFLKAHLGGWGSNIRIWGADAQFSPNMPFNNLYILEQWR